MVRWEPELKEGQQAYVPANNVRMETAATIKARLGEWLVVSYRVWGWGWIWVGVGYTFYHLPTLVLPLPTTIYYSLPLPTAMSAVYNPCEV